MLSRQDNETLTRVGPGTPMGELFRAFWLPALLEEEIGERDGAPVRVRLLGEDLVAFRDTDGRVGIVDAYCPHRRAGLFFGRNEQCGLRCVYHGWKFDVDGRCVDMPSEPRDTGYKEKIRIKAYRTAVRGGIVWIYMGGADQAPELPALEWANLPVARRTATKRLQQCNWAQAVEGGIDSAHISFLHSRSEPQNDGVPSSKYHALDRHPVFEVDETDYGLRIAARRKAEPDHYYWRITQFLLPCYTMIPPVGDFRDSGAAPYDGHAWVPIDDENTWTWSFSASPHADYSEAERSFRGGRDGFWGPVDASYFPLLNRSNDYRIDRELQRTGNFTGIQGIPNQDAAVQESMGAISDRSQEHLGASDRGIVQFRRLMLRLAKAAQDGVSPDAARSGGLYRIRSASVVLHKDVDVDQGARYLTHAALGEEEEPSLL